MPKARNFNLPELAVKTLHQYIGVEQCIDLIIREFGANNIDSITIEIHTKDTTNQQYELPLQ